LDLNRETTTARLASSNYYDRLCPLILLVGIVVLLAIYACALNTLYYRIGSPFFDSASYTLHIAQVNGAVRHHGIEAALRIIKSSTAPLPGLEVVVLTKLRLVPHVSRQLGVALQAAWLLVLALAMFFYWTAVRDQNRWVAVGLTLPLLMFSGIFDFNGGLSDFRLDLSLYIFLAITLTLYLMTERFGSGWLWALTGVSAGLACLARATAPVYLSVMLGPVLAIRLWRSNQRGRLMRQIGVMLIPALGLGITWISINYSYLYYYYFVWNADANAKLPLRRSLFHVWFAFEHIGPVLACGLTFFTFSVLFEQRASLKRRQVREIIQAMDWKFLYIGLAPVLFLLARGAGLNPFVSMPAVFGLTMFALAPLKAPAMPNPQRLARIALVGVLIACGWNAVRAVGRHSPEGLPRMATLKQAIELMRADAISHGRNRIAFQTAHLWYFNADFIKNVLIYEFGADTDGTYIRTPDGICWESPYGGQFNAAVPVSWSEIIGKTDAEKIETLFREGGDLDYIFFPDASTIDILERDLPSNFINLKVRAIKKRFLESGAWLPVGSLLEMSPREHVQMYARVRPVEKATLDRGAKGRAPRQDPPWAVAHRDPRH
jgi:hypothetical protein